ncbi:MAG: sigma-54 dependent transcriptional regulator [Phycisphaerae bacterium]|nr:sigma-54 dependent transcriptional regulator [Phycisphaerae bacterium]
MNDARHNVLMVSSDAQACRLLLSMLASRGVRACAVRDRSAAMEHLRRDPCGLVIVDVCDAADGLDLLAEVSGQAPERPLLALGLANDVELAVAAIRQGAADLLPKPLDRDTARRCLDRLLPSHEVASPEQADTPAIAGASPPLMDVLSVAKRIAPTSAPVLLTGESGTGKEVIAEFIHRHSRRGRGPYVRVNCAALSESLLESELFGHERGAFTGAVSQRKGKFERADGGTLLLDEISETSPRLQSQLLRVLEQQEFERVGGCENVRVNVRVIATSNRDLSAEVSAGRFRRDLYYRLGGVHLAIPPLRERPEDIAPLVWHFVNVYGPEAGRSVRQLDDEMLRLMSRFAWPGNVRQLRNVVRTALIMGVGERLSLEHSPALAAELSGDAGGEQALTSSYTAAGAASLSLHELERQAIFEALRRTQSHQARAAKLLGITDRTLREKLRRYRQAEELAAAVNEANAAAPTLINRAGCSVASETGEASWISQ